MTLTESTLTETLDRRGLLDASRGPGCYCLAVERPPDLGAAWDAHFDARPAGFDRFESARSVVYCGASGDVYARLCEHIDGSKRKARVLEVCDVTGVVDVTPAENPFDREWGYANTFATADVSVWTDGEVL